MQNERKKIAGNNAKKRSQGMAGVGRAYSTKCGLTHHNGQHYSLPAEIQVNLGDTVVYEVGSGQFDFSNGKIDSDSGVNIGDLNSRIDTIRESADETLQLGVVLVCNRTLLRVIRRPSDVWHVEAGQYFYELKVIGFTGANRTIAHYWFQNVNKWIHSEAVMASQNLGTKAQAGTPYPKWILGKQRIPAQLK